jgi:hypothetical protein
MVSLLIVYSPQHSVLRHPQSMCHPYCMRSSFYRTTSSVVMGTHSHLYVMEVHLPRYEFPAAVTIKM